MCSVPLKSIPETFAGTDVFITGGTGFMGKVLIEKLLRSCPKIGRIFVLLRPRKGKKAHERVEELVKVPLFDTLRALRPNDIQKIVPISGDCSQLKLGMEEESVKRLESVEFVFHAAASVRFDDPLQKAILLNTRGTREVFRWAETLKNLRAIVHVSTTYCNPEIFDIEERIYPAKMDWRKAIEIAENVDSEVLETLSHKLTNFSPNTYTFAKGLAEQICYDYHKKLPVVVFRPSVVINTDVEPIPGWIDNYNGPAGLLAGCASGVVRTGQINLDNHLNCIPVDVSIKAILVAAWKRANGSQGDLTIYNSAAEPHKTFDYRLIITDGAFLYFRAPMLKMFWAPGGTNSTYKYSFYVQFFLCQLLGSMIGDLVLRLNGKKPFLVKLQRKIFNAQVSLKHFTDNEWVFTTDNFRNLQHELHESDRNDFNLTYFSQGLVEYLGGCILGGRRYLFKESDDSIPLALKRLKLFLLADRILKLSLCCTFVYLILKRHFLEPRSKNLIFSHLYRAWQCLTNHGYQGCKL